MERCIGALVALVALVPLVSACAARSWSPDRLPDARPSGLTVSGTVAVRGAGLVVKDELTCATTGGYADIQRGAQVVVTDASSTTIALGQLSYGSWDRQERKCVFLFTVAGVPAGHRFYGVEVSHRGRLQFTDVQVTEPLALTLGP